jgi:hypothetical protein
MSFTKQSVPPSKRKALAEIRVLAESGGEILILSPQGFLLIFRDRTPEMLARQLRDFDTAEWRDQLEMDQLFPIDLEGMVERERMRDAGDLFALCSSEAMALLNQNILNISASNVEFYNYISPPIRSVSKLEFKPSRFCPC